MRTGIGLAHSAGRRVSILVLCLGWLACSGSESTPSDEPEATASQPAPAAAQQLAAPASEEERAELAARGEGLFVSKGCSGCHTIGSGRLTGPDLQAVTERRDDAWIAAMMTSPDSMLQNDAEARKLFAEYMTPMVNMGVTQEEARALIEYLRAGGN